MTGAGQSTVGAAQAAEAAEVLVLAPSDCPPDCMLPICASLTCHMAFRDVPEVAEECSALQRMRQVRLPGVHPVRAGNTVARMQISTCIAVYVHRRS